MPRSRCSKANSGASAPEYAIGAGVLAVALLFGLQAVEDAAADRYEDQRSLVATPVSDAGGAGTTTTVGGSTTTVALPPMLTTTTTAPPGTTTTTTTAAVPSLTLTAQGVPGSGTNWSITFTVASDASPGTVVTATASNSGATGTCTLSGGTCTGSIGGLKGNDGTQSVRATAPGVTPSNTVSVPVA